MGPVCVAFDVDDTLYLERDYIRSGFAVAEGALPGNSTAGFADLCWELFAGGRRGDIFDRALVQLGLEASPRTVRLLLEAYRSHTPAISLLPDAEAALALAATAGPVSIVTDGPIASQANKVAALRLRHWASHVILTDEWGVEFAKPHVRAFEHLMAATGLLAEACVYVADNPAKDFIAPHALGWRTVRVRRPSSLHEDVPNGDDVDIEVSGLTGLADLLHLAE